MMHEKPVMHEYAAPGTVGPCRPDRETPPPARGPRRYAPPSLDRLGAWSALTLQQSVPIFP